MLMHLRTLISRVALPQVCKVHIIRVKAQLLPGHHLSSGIGGLSSLTHVRSDCIIPVMLQLVLLLLLHLVKLLHGLRPLQADYPFLLESLQAVQHL